MSAFPVSRGHVRAAARRDLGPVTEMLGRAFYDDPQFMWLLPSDPSRPTRLRRFFGTLLRVEGIGVADVDVVTAGDRVVGAAVWFPPGGWPPPMARQLRALPGYVRTFGKRVTEASVLVNAAARAHPTTPYWYLACIGVEPTAQGRGFGASLLRSRLAECDRDGVAAFLESSKPDNVPLYSHFGFVAGEALKLPEGAPVVTPMTRRPRHQVIDVDAARGDAGIGDG